MLNVEYPEVLRSSLSPATRACNRGALETPGRKPIRAKATPCAAIAAQDGSQGCERFLRAPLVRVLIESCRVSGTGSSNEDPSRVPVPLTRHQSYVPRYQGLLAKGARTPGYPLPPLARRLAVCPTSTRPRRRQPTTDNRQRASQPTTDNRQRAINRQPTTREVQSSAA